MDSPALEKRRERPLTPRQQSTLNVIAINTLYQRGPRKNLLRDEHRQRHSGCDSSFLYWNTVSSLMGRGLVEFAAKYRGEHDVESFGNTDVRLTVEGVKRHSAWN